MNAIITLMRVRCSACNCLFDFVSAGSRVMKCPHCGETYLLRRGEWVNAKLVKPSKPTRALYVFNWADGGWNHVYACTKREALKLANKLWEGHKPDPSSFRRISQPEAVEQYWRDHRLD